MPVEPVFETKINRVSILDEHGVFDKELGEGLIPNDDLVAMYKHMMTCRHFDEIAFKLQRWVDCFHVHSLLHLAQP